MTGVQIIGKDAVLSRFRKSDTDTWALFQGKQFIASGQGDEDLSDWLDDMLPAGSTATYTLRTYEGAPPTSSGANSDYISSFNFKLVDMYEGAGIGGHNLKLMQRIDGLEKKLAAQEEDDGDESLNDVLMGWLRDPEKLGMVVGAIRQFMGGPAAAVASPVQAVSGFNVSHDAQGGNPPAEQKLERLAGALDKLEKSDPALVEHLEKLATLAQNDPLIFKGVISKLDAL